MQKILITGLKHDECYIDDDGVIVMMIRDEHTEEAESHTSKALRGAVKMLRAQGKPVLVLINMLESIDVGRMGRLKAYATVMSVGANKIVFVVKRNSSLDRYLLLCRHIVDLKKYNHCYSVADARDWLLNNKVVIPG